MDYKGCLHAIVIIRLMIILVAGLPAGSGVWVWPLKLMSCTDGIPSEPPLKSPMWLTKEKRKPKQRRHLLVGPDERIGADSARVHFNVHICSFLWFSLPNTLFFLTWMADIYTSIISVNAALTEPPFLHVSPVSSWTPASVLG